MGRMAERQGVQTGKREMLMRGVPQRRQSAGKRVANSPSAKPFIQETTRGVRLTLAVPESRVEFPLLLKTDLPHPDGSAGAPAGRIWFSIAALNSARNARRHLGSNVMREHAIFAVLYRDGDEAVAAAEAITTANGSHQGDGKEKTLGKSLRTGAVPFGTSTVGTVELSGQHCWSPR